MATTMTATAAPAITRVARRRALCVVGGVAAAVAVWAVAVLVLGVHLTIRFGDSAPQSVAVGFVVGASLVGGLLGWGLLALLERRTAAARTIWTAAAFAVLAVSLSLPLIAATTLATKVTLALMHVAVGSVVIPGLRRR